MINETDTMFMDIIKQTTDKQMELLRQAGIEVNYERLARSIVMKIAKYYEVAPSFTGEGEAIEEGTTEPLAPELES